MPLEPLGRSSRLEFAKQLLQPEPEAGGDGATDRARGAASRRRLSMSSAVPPPKGSISFTVSWLPDGGVWRPPSSADLRLPSGAYTAERVGRARASKSANSPAKQAENSGGGFAAALGEADGGAGSGAATPPRLFGAWRLGDKEDDELVANAQLGF